MDIPYVVTPRPDTGLSNAKLGTWLFLASEVMLFGALFSTYIFMRVGAAEWPEQSEMLSVPIGMINTILLIGSSVTMVFAWASLKMNNFGKFQLYLGATFLLGLAFLIIKTFFEYLPKVHHDHIPSTNNFFAIYYTLTGLHGLHVLGGLVVMVFFLGPGKGMWKTEPERLSGRIEVTGLYWHFVDLVWIFLFPVLYLL